MVCEFGTVGNGGDVNVWYQQAFYHIDHTYRRGVRAIIFFNQLHDETMPGLDLDWSITQNASASKYVSNQLAVHSAL
jgi:hypothetical protein